MEHDAKAIIKAIERLGASEFVGAAHADLANDLGLAIVAEGRRIEDLQPYLDALRDAPKRIETSAVAEGG